MGVEELPNEGPHGGIVVRHLTEAGPAAKAGIRKGDIIVRVSNLLVDDFDDLLGAIAGHKAGDELTFTVLRDDERKRVKVMLGGPAKKGAKSPEGCHACAYLGAMAMPVPSLSEETADRLGITDDRGLVILDVVPGSPACAAGLRHGDVIRSIDGKEVRDPETLRSLVHKAGVGKEVKFQVRRGDHSREVRATLAAGPCDVLLVTPRSEAGAEDSARVIERLEKRLERLEKRLKTLEGKRDRSPEK
jgi:serine protease Do